MSYVFKLLAKDWDSLTDAQKIAYFTGTKGRIATPSQLASLGKYKIMVYDDNATVHNCTVKGIPHPQLVKSARAISTLDFEQINSISVSATVNNCTLKVAFTNDMVNYFGYDFINGVWHSVDVHSSNNFLMHGMDYDTVQDLTAQQIKLLNTEGKLGFAYLLDTNNTSYVPILENVTFNIDYKPSWDSCIQGKDYNYGYPVSNVLSVKLLTNGTYKINYNMGEYIPPVSRTSSTSIITGTHYFSGIINTRTDKNILKLTV